MAWNPKTPGSTSQQDNQIPLPTAPVAAPTTLAALADVDVSGAVDGQVLRNNNGIWKADVVAGGGLVGVVNDTFTRADSGTSLGVATSGQSWFSYAGTYGIVSNQAAFTAGSGGNNLAVLESGKANCKIKSKMVYASTGGDDWQRLVFRVQDASNYWCVQLQGTTLSLFLVTNGGFSTLASTSSEVLPTNKNTLMEINCNANNVTVTQDGVPKLVGTNATFNTQTRHGIGGGSNVNFRWDDFTVSSAS